MDSLILLSVCNISEPFPSVRYFRACFCIFVSEDLKIDDLIYPDRLDWDTKIHGHKYGNWLLETENWRNEVSVAYYMGFPPLSSQSREGESRQHFSSTLLLALCSEAKYQMHVVRGQVLCFVHLNPLSQGGGSTVVVAHWEYWITDHPWPRIIVRQSFNNRTCMLGRPESIPTT